MNFEEFKAKYEHKQVFEYPNQVTDKPLVSVCIQTYNHADYINECIDGILDQKTNFPIEILLGEDGSTDGTREICIEYARKHSEIIKLFLHHRDNNIKIGETPTGRFNFLNNLFSAKGKYIALCEGDDHWNDPLKLHKAIDFLELNPDYVLTHHDAIVMDEKGIIVKTSKLPEKNKKDFSGRELQRGPFLLTLSLCYRNVGILKNIPCEIMQVLNADKFLISLLGAFGNGKFFPEIEPAIYRIHNGGIWSKIDPVRKEFNLFNTFNQLAAFYERIAVFELYIYFRTEAKIKYRRMLTMQLRNGDFKGYFRSVIYYYNNNPSSVLEKCLLILYAGYKGTGSYIKKSIIN